MHCTKCKISFTKESKSDNTNKKGKRNTFGADYMLLTEKLFDFLKNEYKTKNDIKEFTTKNVVCNNCFNLYYKNNTVQYINPNNSCYFCWNKKKIEDKSNTSCCDKCQRNIAKIKEEGLINLTIEAIKSRFSKLFKSEKLNFVYHNDDFNIDSETKLDLVISNILEFWNIVIEFDSAYHASEKYEKEKLRSIKSQNFFKQQNINTLYIRFGWQTKIDTDKLQKSLIILFDYLMLKLYYPTLYGFIIIGYPTTCKKVLQYRHDWNSMCSPFLCNNQRPYLDWESNDGALNKFNAKSKIFDRLHVIYDNKKSHSLFCNSQDRFFLNTDFFLYFLNDATINIEKVLLLQNKFFITNNDQIVKIKHIEAFEQIGICAKKFRILLEILNINDKTINEKYVEYSFCDIKILKNKVDNFINELNENNIIINKKYKLMSFENENKIIVNDILQYQTNIDEIFKKKLFSNNNDQINEISELCLKVKNININKLKRKRYENYVSNNNKKCNKIEINASLFPENNDETNSKINETNEYISIKQIHNHKKSHQTSKKSQRLQLKDHIKRKYKNKIKCVRCLEPQNKNYHNKDETCYLYYLNNRY